MAWIDNETVVLSFSGGTKPSTDGETLITVAYSPISSILTKEGSTTGITFTGEQIGNTGPHYGNDALSFAPHISTQCCYDGWYVTSGSGAKTLSITGMPAGTYDIVYSASRNVAQDGSRSTRVILITGTAGVTDQTFDAGNPSSGTVAPHVIFAGVTPASGTIEFTYDAASGASFGYLSAIAITKLSAAAINSISSPLNHGDTGKSITTTGLGTLTSLTVDTVSVTALSAPSGDGTFAMPVRGDGVTLAGYGVKTVVASDGTLSPTTTVTVSPAASQAYVTLTSAPTTTGYLGAYLSGLSIGDQITYDTAATLGVALNYIDVDGGIFTDYAGLQTLWWWNHTTRVVTEVSLVNGSIILTPASLLLMMFF